MMMRHMNRGEPVSADDAPAWIAGLLPDDMFVAPVEITIDRDEILVVGRLAPPTLSAEATGDQRIRLARQIEHRYQRKMAWGVECGETRQLFTTLSAPVMTRLRQPERKVLDTLVDAGVARSRSEALAWCVRMVGEHAEAWLDELRE